MWRYRKEFIEAYWQKGYITEAWVVLGREAYKNRLNFLKKDYESYGKINRGANPIHSVLLFQIDNLVLSEWNYNGKVRLWHNNSKYSPQFYKKEYLKERLNKKPRKRVHPLLLLKPIIGKKKLSEYIEKYTYIFLS